MGRFFTFLLILLSYSAPIFAETLLLQKATVRFICDTRFGKVQGDFSKIQAQSFDPVKKLAKIQIETASLSTGNSMRDKHLKGEDFFFCEKYPSAVFELTSLEGEGNLLKLSGKLTIKEITKELEFPVELLEQDSLRIYKGSVRVNRRDFQMNYDNFINPIENSVLIEVTANVEVKK